MDKSLENLGRSKRAFFEFIVSKDYVNEESFEELKKVSQRAYQYGKANTNARYRSYVLSKTGIDNMCCEYCGRNDLKHNPLKTRGTESEFIQNTSDFFYGSVKVDNPATVDHINPISLGGKMVDYMNLSISCEECNSQKASMTFLEWETFMKGKKKFEYFFKANSNSEKYIDARKFKPDTSKYYTYKDEVKLDRANITTYMRYVLGSDYGNLWQNILSNDNTKIKYVGSKDKPNIKKRQWIDCTGEKFNIDEVKLKLVKKHYEIIRNEKYFNLFYEIHNLNLNQKQITKWTEIFSDLIETKDTNKKQ